MTSPETPFLTRVEYELSSADAVTFSDAPRLYAWLLEQLSSDEAGWIHEGDGQALTQHVWKEPETGKTIWSVSLLSREANCAILPAMKKDLTIELHPETLNASMLRQDSYATPLEFIQNAKRRPVERLAELSILSPLAFHQAGRYVIYPEERLLLQSLLKKWNAAAPAYTLEDEDAIRSLEDGLLIRDYRLHTVRFALKGNKIPGCLGKLYLQSRLPEPLFEIWNLLLWFGCFSGAGIKTTLGMGAMDIHALRE